MSQIDDATGSLLQSLTRGIEARRVLEIGTGDGDAALWMANGLPEDGMLITVERDEAQAMAARTRFEQAGVSARISVMIGEAARYLHKISGPFDLVLQHHSDPEDDVIRARLLQLLRAGGVLARTRVTADVDLALTIKR